LLNLLYRNHLTPFWKGAESIIVSYKLNTFSNKDIAVNDLEIKTKYIRKKQKHAKI